MTDKTIETEVQEAAKRVVEYVNDRINELCEDAIDLLVNGKQLAARAISVEASTRALDIGGNDTFMASIFSTLSDKADQLEKT